MKKFFNFAKKKQKSEPLGAGASVVVSNSDAGYDVREKDLPKLHKAAWIGDVAKVQQLVRKDPSALDKDNRTALHLACVQGHTQVVQILLEWKAKSNIGDNQAKTPLIKAVECGKEDCVILLLQHRADIGVKDCDGNSALHHAIKANLPALCRLLIKGGANINLKNKDGYAPLHFAIMEKRDELTRILLSEKADPDVQDANGRTPMMLACYEGLITPVRFLLQHKANVVIKDKKGFTAEDIANMTGQHACTQLLSDHLTKLRRSTSGNSIPGTPRSSMGIPSASTTPRPDASMSAMLPAMNMEHDESDDDQTLSRQSTHDRGDDSWDDSVSLGIDAKKKSAQNGSDIEGEMPEEEGIPKISLAKALKSNLPSDSVSDDGGGDTQPVDDEEDEMEDEEGDEENDNRNASKKNQDIFRGKQNSGKSLQSATSVEEDWSDDDQSPSKRANGTTRVSFKSDDDIKEMTTEEDTDIEDDNTESAAKKPKLDIHQAPASGYVPTGATGDTFQALDKDRQKGPNVKQNALMDELGISDPSDISDPELSDHDDSPIPIQPKLNNLPSGGIPNKDEEEEKEDKEESDWDSSHITPRAGILKNWKQHSKEQVEKIKNKEQTSKSEISEWDSDLENELDPDNPPSAYEDPVEAFVEEETNSQWDSTTSGVTPRGQGMPSLQQKFTNDIKELEEEIEDMDDGMSTPAKDLLQTTSSFGSGTTQQTVIERKKEEVIQKEEEEKEEESEWDSDEGEDLLPSESNAPPVYMPDFSADTVQVQGVLEGQRKEDHSHHTSSKGDHSVTEDVEEESISEWEIARMNEKAERQQSIEEEKRRAVEEEAVEQAEREAEIVRIQKEEEREAELIRLEEEVRQQKFEAKRRQDEMRWAQEQEELRQKEYEEKMKQEEEEAQRKSELLQQEQAEQQRQQEWEVQQRVREEELRKEAEEEAMKEEMESMKRRDVSPTFDEPTSPKSPDSVTYSKKRELKKVNLLSVKDFVRFEGQKSPEPKLQSSSYSSTQDVDHAAMDTVTKDAVTRDTVVEETISPVKQDIIEVSTSFGVQSSANMQIQSEPTHPGQNLHRDSDLHRSQKSSSDASPSFDQSHTVGVTSFGRGPASHKSRLTPTLAHPHTGMHSDGMSVDDDDSVDLEFDRPDMGSYLRGLPSGSYGYGYKGLDIPDDDVLSYTSTENGDSMIYQTNLPYGKDVLANMNLSDPGAVLKLQEHMHDQNKKLDQERNQRMAIENKYRSTVKEKNELNKKVESLSHSRSSLEQLKLDLEQKIRNLEYNLNEETEIRKNAETLLTKTKEQLSRKEEQYTGEIEAKQKAELQMRNLQIELRSATNSNKTLEDEKSDLQRQLQNEKNARILQEQINDDQQKLQHALQEGQLRSSMEKDDEENEAEHKLETVDENRKALNESLQKLKAENNAIKVELEKQRARHRDEVSMLSAENEELHSKMEELKNDIKLNEEALSHASMQYQLQLSNVRTESTVINSVLEKERASREKIEAELDSLKTRLHTSMLEIDKSEQARNDAERRLHHEREDWTRQNEAKEKEISSLKDSSQSLLQRLQLLDGKLASLENELHISNTTLLERSNHLQQAQKDLQYYKSAQDNFDQNYKLEKELNNKLQSKNEQMQEKITNIQHENLTLKQQLETTQHALLERSGDSKAEQYNNIIASMKTDHEKSRAIWEERNTSLSDQCTRLKEENRNLENRRNKLEEDLDRKEKESQENTKKLAKLEAHLENFDTKKLEFETQRTQYRMETDILKEKFEKQTRENENLKGKVSELSTLYQQVLNKNDLNTEKLLNNSANMEAFSKSKEGLEENYQQLKLEHARLEAELKHEKQKSDMLQKDLQDSQKVRNSLEALCANLKSSNTQLEDKLTHDASTDFGSNEESTTKSLICQEAEENKDLWEKEVISRSKLGLRIVSYEKSKQEAFNQLEEERRKHRKTMDQKRTAEAKLEAELEKNTQLQKEVASLKAYLKVAKKRLKAVDGQDARLGTLHADFERERLAMESTLSSARQQNKVETGYVDKEELERVRREMETRYRMELNRKLEDVNNYLDEQARARERLDSSRDETEYKLKDDKKKIQDENAALRIQYEQALAQKESKELEVKRYRDLYESEMQWRMRLSNQLMTQSDKAFNYKSNIERQRNRTLNNMGNLTFSGTLNGQVLDVSKLSNTVDDLFQSKLKAELDRSINKHLEAAPHDNFSPYLRSPEDGALNTSYAKSNAEYLETLKRKFRV